MSNTGKCALYLRSSKDRHEVSIDAQRRELVALAAAKSLAIAAEYSDAVEAANDWSRPGFRRLLLEISSSGRGWDTLLVFDTSRLARDVHLAGVFRQECRRRGITVRFAKIPQTDPLGDLITTHVYQLVDHIHSHMSREKGLAGMAENVHKGFRAGGAAPHGYQLEPVATGGMRDGAPVTKTRLVPSTDAPAIAAYLKSRAAGLPARQAARSAGVRLSLSSLADVEWRALTYAGHTVWNQHRARGVGAGGYDGGKKRRPREEWLVQRDTHPALITTEEAEILLAGRARPRSMRNRGEAYLLSGLLVSPAGARWHGDKGFYRCGRRRMSSANLERQVLEALRDQLLSDPIVKQTAIQARAIARPGEREGELRVLQREAAELERRIARVRGVMTVMQHPEGMAPKLDELLAAKKAIDLRAASLVDELSGGRVRQLITEDDVREYFRSIVESLGALERADLKANLRAMLDRVTVDPSDLSCRLYYAIPAAAGVSVASPRGSSHIPAFRLVRSLRLTGFRRAA